MLLTGPQVSTLNQILDEFDPSRQRVRELSALEQQKLQQKGDKWDKLVKEDELADKVEETKARDFSKEQDDYLHKLAGCSKNHGQEIDLYNKSFGEKIDRIQTLLKEAEKERTEKETEEDFLQRRCYYYQQALLVFYYLIPEGEEQDQTTKRLQLQANTGQARTFFQMQRFDDCLQQVHLARSVNRENNLLIDLELQILFQRQRIDECRALLKRENCPEEVKAEWTPKLKKESIEHARQEKELYKKMLA